MHCETSQRFVDLTALLLTLQTSPLAQKLFGSSASGSQSQPSGRHLHCTQLLPAAHVESASAASGSPANILSDMINIFAAMTWASQSQPGGKTGAQPAEVRAAGGFATQTCSSTICLFRDGKSCLSSQIRRHLYRVDSGNLGRLCEFEQSCKFGAV